MNQSMVAMSILMMLLLLGQALAFASIGRQQQQQDDVDDGGAARRPHWKGRRRSDAQRLIDAIPVTDRAYFVTVHLAMEAKQQGRNDVSVRPGVDRIPDDLYDEFKYNLQNLTVPKNFGRNLLSWTESLVSVQTLRMRSNDPWFDLLKVCFPSGCVDPGDIGSTCCPF